MFQEEEVWRSGGEGGVAVGIKGGDVTAEDKEQVK